MRWLRMRPESWKELELGVPPQGGGAPERQGTGALNVGISSEQEGEGGSAGAPAGEDKAGQAASPVAPRTSSASVGKQGVTNLGRPIAGRGR